MMSQMSGRNVNPICKSHKKQRPVSALLKNASLINGFGYLHQILVFF